MQHGLEGAPEVLHRSQHVVGRRHYRAERVRAIEGREIRGLRASRRSGSDWQEFKVIELATKTTLTDKIEWVKVSGVAWHGDGFFYSRYPAPPAGQEKASINENHQVFFHRVGTPQSEDVLVYEDAHNPQRFHTLRDDRRRALRDSDDLRSRQGQGRQRAVRARSAAQAGARRSTPRRSRDHRQRLVRRRRQRRRQAAGADQPRGAELACGAIDPARPDEANWMDVLPERRSRCRARARREASCSRST